MLTTESQQLGAELDASYFIREEVKQLELALDDQNRSSVLWDPLKLLLCVEIDLFDRFQY